jgi:hypothetical protein
MDQFMKQRLRNEVDVATGDRVVDWVRFDDIRHLWDAALATGTPEVPQEYVDNADEYYAKVREQERLEAIQRDKDLIPNFIQDMKNALGVNLREKDSYREIDPFGLDRGNQAYETAVSEDMAGNREAVAYTREMNDMVNKMSGADQLGSW